MKLTKCPYCNKQLSYLTAFVVKRNGEYFCNKCKKESNIFIKKSIFIPLIVAIILAGLILSIFLIMTDRENLWFAFFVAIPFLIFYLITPFFVYLKPKKSHMDTLYDTQIGENSAKTTNSSVVKRARTVPAYIDDIVSKEEYKTSINADIFNTIKEERKVINDDSGTTRSFDKFENISSSKSGSDTMPISDLKKIAQDNKNKDNK